MHPLKLQVSPGASRLFFSRKSDPAFIKFMKKIWKRDFYTCQFCGFQANKYQEVVNIDGNYRNNRLSNLVTACCFCSQCLFLEMVGKGDYGGGTLIHMPELAQPEVNGLSHVLFCAIANGTDYRVDAQNVYRNLKMRSQIVEDKLGEGMSNPDLVGQMLLNVAANQKERNPHWLSELRLLPARARFKEQIDTWAAAALEEMAEE